MKDTPEFLRWNGIQQLQRTGSRHLPPADGAVTDLQ